MTAPTVIGARRVGIVAMLLVALAACADDANDTAAGGWSSFPTTSTAPDDAVAHDTGPDDTGPDDGPDDGGAGPSTSLPDAEDVGDVEPTGEVVPVIALDNSFRPQIVEISVGDEVAWENRGMNEHDVLYVEGDDWGVEVTAFQPGDVYRHVFTEPGEYRYYCSIHGNAEVGMTGTVLVTG